MNVQREQSSCKIYPNIRYFQWHIEKNKPSTFLTYVENVIHLVNWTAVAIKLFFLQAPLATTVTLTWAYSIDVHCFPYALLTDHSPVTIINVNHITNAHATDKKSILQCLGNCLIHVLEINKEFTDIEEKNVLKITLP